MKIYFDFRDWWIGYYRGSTHHYVCVLPTLVIRWKTKKYRKELKASPDCLAGIPIHVSPHVPPNKAFIVNAELLNLVPEESPKHLRPGSMFWMTTPGKKILNQISEEELKKIYARPETQDTIKKFTDEIKKYKYPKDN